MSDKIILVEVTSVGTPGLIELTAVGPQGPIGDTGATGYGVPVNGTPGQILSKNSVTNYDTKWINLAAVATTGAYADLSGKPTAVSAFTNDAGYITTTGARTAVSVAGSLAYNSTTGVISYTAPTLAAVATTGAYADLSGKPTAVSAFTNDAGYITTTGAREAISATGSLTYSNGVISYTAPTLAAVATTGAYADLSGKPNLSVYELFANKNIANGYAGLDNSGKLSASQLPSYVDDVLEYSSVSNFPSIGEAGKIYVAIDINKTYRWTGSVYIEISSSPGSTDGIAEGITNLYFTTVRAREAISATGSLTYSNGVISYTAPTLAAVATTGAYADLSGKPTAVSAFTNDAGYITTTGARTAVSVAGSLAYNSTTGVISYTAPTLAAVATTGAYADLSGKPTAVSAFTNDAGYITTTGAREAISATGSLTYSNGVISYTAPTLAAVATTGAYADLSGKPTAVSAFTNDASYITPTSTQTLTNKRVDPRVLTQATTTTITPDISMYDMYAITAQSGALTFAIPIGTPLAGSKILFRIKDNGTPASLTFNAIYRVIGVTLPTVTTASKVTYIGCIYNAVETVWDVIAVSTQA